MKTVRRTTNTPVGGYQYTQKETGQSFSAATPDILISKVVAHRRANNLPVPFNVTEEIEMYICHEHPELCQEVQHNPRKTPTLDLAIKFTKTLVAAGRDRVDQDEADRRAGICSSCPANQQPAGCTGCKLGIVKRAIEFIAGSRKTAYDSQLKSCNHCGCFNAAQIWLPLDALQSVTSQAENDSLPAHCWKKR